MYARGILFGKMKYELGDHASVRCPETGLEADIEFKVKGWMGGSYNSIGGFIKDTRANKNLYELSGYWHGEMTIKDLSTGKKEVLFDATRAKPSFPKSRPMGEQAERESQRLWASTTQAIKKADQKTATDEKSRIEDEQRREAAEREERHEAWQPVLFKRAPPGDEEQLDWVIDAQLDANASAEKEVQQILGIAPIVPGQEKGMPSSDKNVSAATPQQQQSQQPAKSQPPPPPPPPQNDGAGDLIDFGQNDTSAVSDPTTSKSQAQTSRSAMDFASSDPSTAGQNLQQPLVPKKEPGDPLRRMDSLGEEETFIDAES